MRKLYHLVVPFILAVIFTSNVKAQWNENLSENLLISESGNSNQEMVQIGKTSDEKIFIAWISWEIRTPVSNCNYWIRRERIIR